MWPMLIPSWSHSKLIGRTRNYYELRTFRIRLDATGGGTGLGRRTIIIIIGNARFTDLTIIQEYFPSLRKSPTHAMMSADFIVCAESFFKSGIKTWPNCIIPSLNPSTLIPILLPRPLEFLHCHAFTQFEQGLLNWS